MARLFPIMDETPEAPPAPPSKKKQVIAGLVTVVTLVIVFAGILPQLADYGSAWDAIQNMSVLALGLLVVATVANIVVYVWPYQAALPGIAYGPAFVVRQTSFAISNGVPAGGAFGLGVQYTMLGDYGFGPGPATATIGITGMWNMLITLALPVLAVVALVAVGDTEAWVVSAATVGLVVVAVMVGLLILLFRSESAARRIGAMADRLVTWLAGLFRKEMDLEITAKLMDFRAATLEVVRRRAVAITLTNVLQQLAQFLVLYLALVGIQGDADQTTFAEALVAFSVGRLGSFIPLTPGGLGTVDALITGILVSFGAVESEALAAVLLWRASTYFPQIFIGIGTFLYWRRRKTKRGSLA
jgi:uncharacterized protein (TIRG00374 family)